MLWVCRTGKLAKYYEKCIDNCEIVLPWQGYAYDLSDCQTLADFRKTVENEKDIDNRTSISNWSSQLFSFCKDMQIGDYVLIPNLHSKKYDLVKIVSNYFFRENDSEIHHVRKIKICCRGIPREIFPQSIQYSLGAFRTIFKPKHESEILALIEKWKGCESH